MEKESLVNEDIYERKHNLLKQKYRTIRLGNDKLRNRIYHVQKEIRYLKKLKRFLIQRLISYNDRFMDVCLEIPDNEPGSNIEDKLFDEVVAKAEELKAAVPPAKQKRNPFQKTKGTRIGDRTQSISTVSSISSQLNSPAPSLNSSNAEVVGVSSGINSPNAEVDSIISEVVEEVSHQHHVKQQNASAEATS